ncbi:MAG: polysaccharide export protein [Sphingomonas sp.]|jgi:polysaccharide biosynthesis/export protein|nr:polysaccharide export protein [Sphingomonas sp.]
MIIQKRTDVMRLYIPAVLLGLALAAPAYSQPIPISQASIPTTVTPAARTTISRADRINVTVFREPDLSVTDVLVDDSGTVALPLIGSVNAGGRSIEAVAADIENKLRPYLRNPQVAVVVKQSATKHITVAGSVMEPGRFEVEGPITLLQAIALARGPSQVASLDQALIFRTQGQQKTAARFDLRQIERGKAEDPAVLPGDTVAIGSSKFKTAWRDTILTLRSFNIFRLVP